jgi:biopolymer transport protein ExbD
MAETEAKQPFDTGSKKKARIEIIPLIDVIFFLLATFVLFTLSLNKIQALGSKLPVQTGEQTKDQPPAIVQVSEGDSIFFNREPISLRELQHYVSQYKNSADGPARVLLSGDDRAKYGRLIQALDVVIESGIERDNISFDTAYRASGR